MIADVGAALLLKRKSFLYLVLPRLYSKYRGDRGKSTTVRVRK